ncbi:ATP-dependent DNA nuclease [Sulfitobacter noctilucae]|uniref:double-strand break repair helicase AddA n=1 Tax=Sulfitobacter noctilucae TaxID=1342302 RepID=UPI00046AFB66|nr:double-strand break repair helicase AddA [Sulfitobacter noctilucae]KIN65763.1 ATP-dependent DNA nuclease [Sulfitobacter noctilucae]
MMINDATRAQIEAARPDASTWLAANAGSGKTRVLTDRVARLLLSGVEPQHILCLTYTKAAASEMQNRLFKRLGAWAMLEEAKLREAMQELGIEGRLDDVQLRKARTLFALAIETPGGLKIQTIHSFCASLLRRFPLEAGVSPQFTEIEDRAADLLRADIIDEMSEGSEAPLIEAIAAFYTAEDLSKLTQRIVGMQEGFQAEQTRADILSLLGEDPDLDARKIESRVFVGDEGALIDRIMPHLVAKGGNDGKAAVVLGELHAFDMSVLPQLEGLFLYGEKTKAPFAAKIDSFPTKATQTVIADDLSDLHDFMQRVEEARDSRLALATAEKAIALHRFASAFLKRYAHAKQMRGWLDFDDLIIRARALLMDKTVAAWVLYRIDGGIDHILVDEAQDTSARQWDVIERLTDEFHSGEGARTNVARTLFVVGDKKQSIYSFQGADPLEFDRRSLLFEEKFKAASEPFLHQSLDYSFRSSSAILHLVDTAFDPDQRPDFGKQSQHIAFKEALPGRVDLWPVVDKADKDENQPWTDPLDRLSPQHHTVILARQIAEKIQYLTDGTHFIPDDGKEPGTIVKRPIRAGDFLILVQRRSALFSEIIRACKALNLPIAGADRLKVGAELAVKDLAALLSFLATPDDDLSLATALKSPLFGWNEQALFDLSHRRTERHLWEALRKRETDFPKTVNVLQDLRGQVDFLRPYDLIERILTRHNGRQKLLGRLGPEAEDGINAMLTQALSYERNDVPSLTGFIEWMQTDDLEIKRQIDSASNQIRVMTVHGSKGLEAPIVILPDTGRRDISVKDEIIRMNGVPLWKPAASDLPEVLRQTTAEMKEAEFAERLRLLYVAMTRAEKWLIVAAAGDLSKDNTAWYDIVADAMSHVNAVEIEGVTRFSEGDWNALTPQNLEVERPESPELEPVFSEIPAIFAHDDAVWSPSDLGGAKAIGGELGEDVETAMAFGTLVHELLETLPGLVEPALTTAATHLTRNATPEDATRAIADARRVIEAPTLAPVFAPGTLAEVPVTATLGTTRFHGIIDRLIIRDDHILLVDYKTNRVVPETPEACPVGILRQMGAYTLMLEQVYTDHRIDCAILWTVDASLMPLPHELVTKAAKASGYLDAPHPRS